MKNKEKILVLGGTGAIGKYLCQSLIGRGYTVYVTSRREHTDKGNLHYICGNAKDVDFLNEIFKAYDFDVIFDFMMYTGNQFKDRYQLFLNNCKQYFFSSSQRVYADSDPDGWLREDSKRKIDCISENKEWAKDVYGCRKGKEEDVLFAAKEKNWTIIRMSMTYSNSRFQFGPLDNFDVVRATRGERTALPDTLADKETTLTYGKVTAELLSSLVLKEGALANVFNVGSKYSYNWEEIANIYNKVLGLTYKIIPEDKYIFATNSQSMMVDRRLTRKLDCSKIYGFYDKKNVKFEKLEDGLKDAWKEADHEWFANGSAKLDAHALIDIYTDTDISKCTFAPAAKGKYDIMYRRMKSFVENDAGINDIFFVTDNPYYWQIAKQGEHVRLKRSENDLGEKHSRWLSIMPRFELKGNKKYFFSMEFNSPCKTTMLIFTHGYAYNSENILRYPVSIGKNIISFTFTPGKTARFLAITATDFPKKETVIDIENVEIKDI